VTFKPEVSLGEILQIALTLFVVAASSYPAIRRWYRLRYPIKLRQMVLGSVIRRRRVVLGQHTETVVSLVLTPRVRRDLQFFNLRCDGRHWLGIDHVHEGVVAIESASMQSTQGTAPGARRAGGVWFLTSTLPGAPAGEEIAGIDLTVRTTGRWRGRIVVTSYVHGTTTRDATIPVVVR
jgi:hypothetical protein